MRQDDSVSLLLQPHDLGLQIQRGVNLADAQGQVEFLPQLSEAGFCGVRAIVRVSMLLLYLPRLVVQSPYERAASQSAHSKVFHWAVCPLLLALSLFWLLLAFRWISIPFLVIVLILWLTLPWHGRPRRLIIAWAPIHRLDISADGH